MRSLILAMGLLAVAACSEQPTRVLVRVDADSGIRGDVSTLRVRVTLGGVLHRDETTDAVEWPRWIVIEPLASAQTPDFRARVDALDAAGRTVSTVSLHARFIPDEARLLRLHMVRGCREVELGDGALPERLDAPPAIGVPCPRWQVPETIDRAFLGDAGAPVIGAVGGGDAIAAWYQYDGEDSFDAFYTPHRCWAARFTGGTWLPPELLDVGGSHDFEYPAPQLVADRDGHAVVQWRKWVYDQMSASIVRRFDGSGWSEATLLASVDSLHRMSLPVLAGSRGGQALSLYSAGTGRSGSWSVSRRFVGGQWEEPQRLLQGETRTYWADTPVAAIDDDGNAFALWSQNIWHLTDEGLVATDSHVSVGRLESAALGWSEPTMLDSGDVMGATLITMRADGQSALALWQRGSTGRFSRFVRGSGWGAAEDLPPDLAFEQLAMDDRGNALTLGVRSGALMSARYDAAAGEFRDLGELAAADGGEVTDYALALEAGGRAVAGWIQGAVAWAARYAPEAGWGEAVRLDPEAVGDAAEIHVAIDEAGSAFATWEAAVPAFVDIRASRYEAAP